MMLSPVSFFSPTGGRLALPMDPHGCEMARWTHCVVVKHPAANHPGVFIL